VLCRSRTIISFKRPNLLGERTKLNHLLKRSVHLSVHLSVQLSSRTDLISREGEGEGLPRANVIRPVNQFCCQCCQMGGFPAQLGWVRLHWAGKIGLGLVDVFLYVLWHMICYNIWAGIYQFGRILSTYWAGKHQTNLATLSAVRNDSFNDSCAERRQDESHSLTSSAAERISGLLKAPKRGASYSCDCLMHHRCAAPPSPRVQSVWLGPGEAA